MPISSLDARDRPPDSIKSAYKRYQKLTLEAIQIDSAILDFRRDLSSEQQCNVRKVGNVPLSSIDAASSRLAHFEAHKCVTSTGGVSIYETGDLPGLLILPNLIPENVQRELLSKLLHRDLANQNHQTNVHLHHLLPYQATVPTDSSLSKADYTSFFNLSPISSETLPPIDDASHKTLTVSQFLNRKLRWITLGGQYNWTEKKYPSENAPSFPEDIAGFIHALFPTMKPEAAILNVYTPGDTLSLHRDVSEESDKDPEQSGEPKCVAVRLHSGDAVVMGGAARFAWHGIPQVIPNSCPVSLRDWPAIVDDESRSGVAERPFEAWRGWMSNKRVNLNIRQMRD